MSACDKAISCAKNLHLDECEAIFSKKSIITIRITNSEIAEIKKNQERKLGVRIINKKRISSAQTSNLDESLVEQALETSALCQPKPFWKSLPTNPSRISLDNLYDKKLAEISGQDAADIAQSMIDCSQDDKIHSISGSLNIVSEKIEIQNTNGLNCSDKATYISGTINADSKDLVSGIGHGSCRTLEEFSPESIGKDAAQMCIGSINPKGCEEGEYSVIFEPYSVGEILAFVVSGNFNLKTYYEKRSCFSDKMGSKIAVDDFNLYDDPHAPQGIGSKPFDDEGTETKKQALIENGIFKNTYSDLFNSFKEGTESSGNASRPGSPMGRSSDPIPHPAPHNLKILGNQMSQDEMVQDTKNGLLVGRLWYTYAVNPIKGDFSCTARSGIRIIKNGQIISPGKPVRIIHNLAVLFQNISAVGNNEKNVLQWASLPSIAPSIRVDGIKVNPI